ncbi:MAG: peptidoglycan-binding protein [Pseudomonadota bacterium]
MEILDRTSKLPSRQLKRPGDSATAESSALNANAGANSQTVNVVSDSTSGATSSTDPDGVNWLKRILLGLMGLISVGTVSGGISLFSIQIGINMGKEEAVYFYKNFPTFNVQTGSRVDRDGDPCVVELEDVVCSPVATDEQKRDLSTYYLKRGDSDIAIDNLPRAKASFDLAISIGRPVGAESAALAATRLQYLNLTCDYDADSLARVARDNEFNILGGEIRMDQRQKALAALRHYTGPVDGKHSQEVRDGVRAFQTSLWFPATGVLTSEQVVLLICGAAEIKEDVETMTLLGVMYATGLGVRQNTDQALQWLESAASVGSADASWNLALLFGTRTTESSALVCDATQNPERADSYLRDAIRAGHPAAIEAWTRHANEIPAVRWNKISSELRTPEALERVGQSCNPNG